MTPLGKIEEGIIGGDWKLVCDGFNRLTGKKVTPPLTKQIQEVFDPNTAKKAQLYSWLKTNTDMEMGPPKEYSIEDLREIVNVHILSEAPAKRDSGYTNPFKSNQDVKLEGGGAFLDGFRYTSGKGKLLPMDTLKVTAALDPQLVKVGDPTNEYIPREPPKKANLKCLKCNKVFEGYAHLGVTSDGELKALCPVCIEII